MDEKSNRRIALIAGSLAIVGMGLSAGCSAKETPAPTAPMENSVESKRPEANPTANQTQAPNSFSPAMTAPPPATAVPGDN